MKRKSEILPLLWPVDAVSVQHEVAFECVPDSSDPRELYVLLDGWRIAVRGEIVDEQGRVTRGWVPLAGAEGYTVIDESANQIAIFFCDERLH